MRSLLLAVLVLSGCTIKVVLPHEPIPVNQATMLAGEDPVNNVMRVTVVEQPKSLDEEAEEICRAFVKSLRNSGEEKP